MGFTKEKLTFLPSDIIRKHVLITGRTGSGKTCTAHSLIAQLQQEDETVIILDPTGEYSKLPNMVVYKLGENTFIDPGKIDPKYLLQILDVKANPVLLHKLRHAIDALMIQENINSEQNKPYKKICVPIELYGSQLEQLRPWMSRYQFSLLPKQLIEEFIVPRQDNFADYSLLGQVYDRVSINKNWNELITIDQKIRGSLFSKIFGSLNEKGTSKYDIDYVLSLFLKKRSINRSLVLDISYLRKYESSQKQIISILLKLILSKRIDLKTNFRISIFIDEAHRYLPDNDDELTENGFFQILREGRKYGLSLILTTQSPLDISLKLLPQFSHFILHHTNVSEEYKSLNIPVQSDVIKNLDTGQAIIYLNPHIFQKVNIQLFRNLG